MRKPHLSQPKRQGGLSLIPDLWNEIDRIAKKIPAGPGASSLERALEEDPDLVAIKAANPELAELFELSVALEGMARHTSTHAAGVVIADRPIVEYVPLCKAGDEVATQWPAPQLEELGLLKMDYLGLRTLTILERTRANVRRAGLEPPDLDELALDNRTCNAQAVVGDALQRRCDDDRWFDWCDLVGGDCTSETFPGGLGRRRHSGHMDMTRLEHLRNDLARVPVRLDDEHMPSGE
jgi:hypothetical protein